MDAGRRKRLKLNKKVEKLMKELEKCERTVALMKQLRALDDGRKKKQSGVWAGHAQPDLCQPAVRRKIISKWEGVHGHQSRKIQVPWCL